MAQLDERTRRDLARLRDRAAPSDAAKQRMYAALEAQLGPDDGGDDPSGDDPGGDPSGGSSGSPGPELLGDGSAGVAWAAKLVGATAGLTVAGLVTLRVGVALVRALSSAPQPDPPRAHTPEQQPVAVASTAPEHDTEELVADVAAIDEAAASDPAPPSAPRSAVATSRSEPEQDTLAAELALLEAAHAARDPAAALRELERHLAKFPHGELADERELLRIETLCRLDRLANARELRDRFLLERPKSALRRRLASACPALTEP